MNRAEGFLSELTPSSRLPTHALFKAYDEVLLENGIDPDDDQLISKLVFMVGGVKNTDSLRAKFKTVMARMNITVQLDPGQAHGSDAGDAYANSAHTPDGSSVAGDAVDNRFVVDKDAHRRLPGPVNGIYTNLGLDDTSDHYLVTKERDGHHLNNIDYSLSSEDNPAHLSKLEQYLETSAIAFRKTHNDKFSAASTLRQWQTKSNFMGNLCEQFDAARQADLEEDVEAKFEAWRNLAAKVDNLPPHSIPPNVYSKRIEGIASRAYEIHVIKTALKQWRQSAREQCHKFQNLEESSDPLERVAAKAHKNLMLSRAFVNWSNRLEKEVERAQMAAKVYEMNLKSKAFGIRQRPSDNSYTSETHIASPPPKPIESDDASRPKTIADHIGHPVAVDRAVPPGIAFHTRERISPEPDGSGPPSNDDSTNSLDGMDETTLLARRHILRMRYYDAWERYTAEHLDKVRDFKAEQHDERVAHAIPIWRSQARQLSQERGTLRYNAERANYYNKAIKAIDAWRQESQDKWEEQDQVLDHYAARANFFYKTTKTLPIWRNETEQAAQHQGVLKLYANRAEYFSKTTKFLPIWRKQTKEAAEREEQTLASYAQRADYYYRTRGSLLAWHDISKQKRKKQLREAHLETRRIVKRGMGERCIAEWREKLQPSIEQFEAMDSILEDITADREWTQTAEALDTWREKAQERNEMDFMSDVTIKGKVLGQWRNRSARQQELQLQAEEYKKGKTVARVLKNWNLRTLQIPNRPLIVANALEKKDRKMLRTGFENWYSRTADKLVPVELSDGSYKSVEQVVDDAQHQASLTQAKGLFSRWQAATKEREAETIPEETYAATPGRPRIFLAALNRMETTTPLAPVPSRWRASETALRGSLVGARNSRARRAERNLRVSWAQ